MIQALEFGIFVQFHMKRKILLLFHTSDSILNAYKLGYIRNVYFYTRINYVQRRYITQASSHANICF